MENYFLLCAFIVIFLTPLCIAAAIGDYFANLKPKQNIAVGSVLKGIRRDR